MKGVWQARNQLGTPGEQRVLWEWPKFFEICSIALNYIQNILPWGRKILHGGLCTPCDPPGYGPGFWCSEGLAVINNVVCCLNLLPAYARGCLSQPRWHTRAETPDSSSEPVYGDPEFTGKVGVRGKTGGWAHARLGVGVMSFHEFILVLLISNAETSRVIARRRKRASTADAVCGGSAGLEWKHTGGVDCWIRLDRVIVWYYLKVL